MESRAYLTSQHIPHGASERPIIHHWSKLPFILILRSTILSRTGANIPYTEINIQIRTCECHFVSARGTELGNPDVFPLVNQHILGLDVPMDDSHFVQRINPKSNLGNPFPPPDEGDTNSLSDD